MTLIVAAKAIDGQGHEFVVLGADTRETVVAGAARVEVNIAHKLFPLTRHSAIMLCGDSGHAQYLISKFRRTKLTGRVTGRREMGVTQLVETFSEFCQDEALDWKNVPTLGKYPPDNRHFPDIAYVIAGFNREGNRFAHPLCYGVSSLTGYLIDLGESGFAIDGKGIIARYIFSKEYHPPMDLPHVTNLVLKCLVDTSEVDGDVGGRYNLAIIDSNRIDPKTSEEIEEMIDDAQLHWPR